MNIEDIPIEDGALYKLCQAVLDEYDAQMNHEYSESLAGFHSRIRGALAFRVKDIGNRRNVSFTLITPPKETDDGS